MAVRDQDRGAACAQARELEPELGDIAAGVDDHAVLGAARRADEVAVRRDRAELEAVDDDVHWTFTAG